MSVAIVVVNDYYKKVFLEKVFKELFTIYSRYMDTGKKYCSSCQEVVKIEIFEGKFKTCSQCRERRRNRYHNNPSKYRAEWKKWYEQNKDEYNEKRKIERAKHTRLCAECNMKVKHENWDEHFFSVYHPNSELNLLFKDYLKKVSINDLSTESRDIIRKEYHKQKNEIYKRLNEQFPNGKLVINHT